MFGQPTFPAITVLVEANDGLAEITNLLYRQNTSPSLAPAADPPKPDPSRLLALVAVGIQAPGADIRRRILSHAEAGTALIVDAPGDNAWWRGPQLKLVKRQEDREFYSLGQGQVVAYREAISDPYEFRLRRDRYCDAEAARRAAVERANRNCLGHFFAAGSEPRTGVAASD